MIQGQTNIKIVIYTLLQICFFRSNMMRLVSIVVFMVLLSSFSMARAIGKPLVPCFFVFGDSLSDCGNNNNLLTRAKANYKPYGVDFPGGNSTGRFSNGRIYIDVLSELLGFYSYIPPYDPHSTFQLTPGTNYASGAAGILLDTGIRLGGRTCLASQVKEHHYNVKRIRHSTKGKVDVSKCLYLINIGSNDYINNYFGKGYVSSRTYSPVQFADLLIAQYHHEIKSLYDHGARKVALFGLGSIGCTPAEIDLFGVTKGSYCVDKVNSAVALFNNRLVSLVDELNNSLRGAKFIYVNSSANPAQGFTVVNQPCCIPRGDDGLCKYKTEPCKNRRDYVFFDPYHPTEYVHTQLAHMAFKAANSIQAYPMDISQLINSS